MLERVDLETVLAGELEPGLSYSEIHARYAESAYGQHHSGQPLRYSQAYGYDRQTMLADLGDDIHPVRHMSHTEKQIAVPLIAGQLWDRVERLSPTEIKGIRLAALIHDIGECEHPSIEKILGQTVGDVHYESKTSSDSELERTIRQHLYDELYADVPDEVMAMADESIDNHHEFHGLAFDTVERVGYFQTAMRAGEVALELAGRQPLGDARVNSLARLALRVSDNHRDVLNSRSADFPYVGRFMRSKVVLDYRIHEVLPDYAAIGEAA